jgi:hypothetical protein
MDLHILLGLGVLVVAAVDNHLEREVQEHQDKEIMVEVPMDNLAVPVAGVLVVLGHLLLQQVVATVVMVRLLQLQVHQ